MPSEPCFTSDTHFGHGNILSLMNRPYPNVNAMDEGLIRAFNEVVTPDTDVYHLGDLTFYGQKDKVIYLLHRLQFRKLYLLRGNHDSPRIVRRIIEHFNGRVEDLGFGHEMKYEGQRIILCHYPLRVWNEYPKGTIQLHGHCHGSLPVVGLQMDVGVDTHPKLAPYRFSEVLAFMNGREIHDAGDHHCLME